MKIFINQLLKQGILAKDKLSPTLFRKKLDEKRIVFIVGSLGIGGAEKQLYLLCQGLLLNGWKINVFTLNPNKNDYWEAPLLKLGVCLTPIRKTSVFIRIFIISMKLIKYSPTIVHGWHFYTNFYSSISGFLAHTKIRCGSIQEEPAYWRLNIIQQILCIFGLMFLISNTSLAIKKVKERFPIPLLPKLILIRNGIGNSDNTINVVDSRKSLANEWNIHADTIWVCALGRQDKNKNWSCLLDSIELLKNRYRFITIFVGDGPENLNLKDIVKEKGIQGYVKFIGDFPNAEKILNCFDILCMTSFSEGLPNVLIEGGQAGLPVIAPSVGAIPELITHGENGLLFTSNNSIELTEQFERLFVNCELRQRLGGNLKKTITSEFSFQKYIDNYLRIYS